MSTQPKITIITPSIRLEGLEIVRKALSRQTFKDYEWLLGTKTDPGITEATWIKDDFTGGFWTLNRIYNKLVSKSRGELICSLQDNIWIGNKGLETFWENHRAQPDALISGVGDQYAELNEKGKPHIVCWNDPRKTTKYGSFYECYWNDIEFNWAAFPRRLFLAVSGMDEQLDFEGYGGDQLQLCDRLNDYGAKFYIDQTNESFTLRHSRDDFGGQAHWDENHVLFNGRYQERKAALIKKGSWPILQTNSKYVISEGR